jgi:hypothetical protein
MTTPNGSGITNRGTDYADGSQVTSTNLNDHVDDAVFNDNAVDDTTIGLNSSTPKALFVKNAGIDTAQIADDAITFDKLADATLTSIKEALYPTGSLLTTTVNYADSADVVTAYGGTTWVRFGEGQVLVGHSTTDGDFNAATPTTGGNKTTTTTTNVPVTGYGTTGGAPGTIGSGRMVVGSGFNESVETLESLRAAGSAQTITSSSINVLQPYITVYMWKRTV